VNYICYVIFTNKVLIMPTMTDEENALYQSQVKSVIEALPGIILGTALLIPLVFFSGSM